MRVLGLIPARGGSKGVPRKNCKLLGGKPLLAYTIDSVKNSKLLTKTILSSDDDEIIKLAKKLGVEAPFIRPASLASDSSPTIDTVIHALKYYQAKDIYFDAVCLLQVTSPFRENNFLDNAIKEFQKRKTDSLISVLKVPHEYNPHWVFEASETGILKISTGESEIISQRQKLPNAYHRDGSIYITRTDVILEQKSLLGSTISYIESNAENHVNIDTLDDWAQAETIVKKYRK